MFIALVIMTGFAILLSWTQKYVNHLWYAVTANGLYRQLLTRSPGLIESGCQNVGAT